MIAEPRLGYVEHGMTQGAALALEVPTFREIYEEHHAFAWRALRHLGVVEAEVDDAVQELFLVVHRRLDDYDPARSIRGWLWGIARHVASNQRRGHARAERRKAVAPTPVDSAQPDEVLSRKRAASFVHDFIQALDDKHREVFVLTELEGFTAPEIASALELNLNTVYARQRRARAKFHDAVAAFRKRGES